MKHEVTTRMRILVRGFRDTEGRFPTLKEILAYGWGECNRATVKREHTRQCEIYREIVSERSFLKRYAVKDTVTAFGLGGALALGIVGFLSVIM